MIRVGTFIRVITYALLSEDRVTTVRSTVVHISARPGISRLRDLLKLQHVLYLVVTPAMQITLGPSGKGRPSVPVEATQQLAGSLSNAAGDPHMRVET